jgi:hypothetical protein
MRLGILLLAVGLFMGSSGMLAHHAETDYDLNTVVVMKGVVSRFEFVNPHIVVRYAVRTSDGGSQEWVSHGGSPNHERRSGWTANTIKPGDDVIVTGFRHAEGRNILQMAIIEVNGKVYERKAGSAFRRYVEFKDKNPGKAIQNYN